MKRKLRGQGTPSSSAELERKDTIHKRNERREPRLIMFKKRQTVCGPKALCSWLTLSGQGSWPLGQGLVSAVRGRQGGGRGCKSQKGFHRLKQGQWPKERNDLSIKRSTTGLIEATTESVLLKPVGWGGVGLRQGSVPDRAKPVG